ncbi:hypothetical protein T02_5397 [Trichinella nativa]|uniref:Uncharacterized protein n=1 Tax=Trichinella nativa TaxID=6335 RepID=A0A0V1LLH9_9BILA|nr:hypothetical protein T02_5397 [Trichinella nativa]
MAPNAPTHLLQQIVPRDRGQCRTMAGTTGSMTVQRSAEQSPRIEQRKMTGQTNHQTEARCLKFIGPAEVNKTTKRSSDTRLGSTGYEPESSPPMVSHDRDPGHGAQPASKKSAEGDKNIIRDLTMVLLAVEMKRCVVIINT